MVGVLEECLGDGVYASWDGFNIWLDLRGQDSTTRIALDPAVLANLKDFAQKVGQALDVSAHKALEAATDGQP